MTRSSVLGEPLLGKDVSKLASIFEKIFRSYCKNINQSEGDYCIVLSTIMGLGFTTALIDTSLSRKYLNYMRLFIRYRDFKQQPERINKLSEVVAEVINGTIYLLSFIDLPQYYQEFVEATKEAVRHQVWNANVETEEIERLLKILFK